MKGLNKEQKAQKKITRGMDKIRLNQAARLIMMEKFGLLYNQSSDQEGLIFVIIKINNATYSWKSWLFKSVFLHDYKFALFKELNHTRKTLCTVYIHLWNVLLINIKIISYRGNFKITFSVLKDVSLVQLFDLHTSAIIEVM